MKSDTQKDFGGGRVARQASLSCRTNWLPVAWGSDVIGRAESHRAPYIDLENLNVDE